METFLTNQKLKRSPEDELGLVEDYACSKAKLLYFDAKVLHIPGLVTKSAHVSMVQPISLKIDSEVPYSVLNAKRKALKNFWMRLSRISELLRFFVQTKRRRSEVSAIKTEGNTFPYRPSKRD